MSTIESQPRLSSYNPEIIFGDNYLSEEIIDGIKWVKLRIYDDYIQNGESEIYQRLRQQSDYVDTQLRDRLVYDHKGALRPQKKPAEGRTPADNPYSEAIYSLKGMSEWYQDTPSARALLPLHMPTMPSLPGRQEEIDDASRNFFTYSLDAQAIRARNRVVSHRSANILSNSYRPLHISYGSGLAVPVFEALAQTETAESIRAILVDMDDKSHEMARAYESEVSARVGGWNVSTEYVNANLINGLIRSDELVDRLGRGQASVVDVVGVAEYFSAAFAGKMLKNAYENVRPSDPATGEPGGILLWGNMLDEHPQLAFNQCAIRWPDIHPRSRAQLTEIVNMIGAPPENVTAYTSEDGVYAIFEIRKT